MMKTRATDQVALGVACLWPPLLRNAAGALLSPGVVDVPGVLATFAGGSELRGSFLYGGQSCATPSANMMLNL